MTIGEDAGDLRLGDLIFGIDSETFNRHTNYKGMIYKYNNRGMNGRVHREDDYEQICKKANKEGNGISAPCA